MQYEAQSQNVVSTEMLQRRSPTTPNAMMREQPGIFGNLVANQGSPIIRGQIGNRVLYLWNGIRINNGASFTQDRTAITSTKIPLGAAERFEVVRAGR